MADGTATDRDVWALLRARARTHGPRPFLIWSREPGHEQSWTYGEFARDVGRLAAGLQRRGIGPGDRILIHLENCPELLLTWFACAAVGAVAVTTNPRSARDEVAYFADHSGVVAAVTQPKLRDRVAAAAPGLRWIASVDADPVPAPTAPGAAPARSESFARLLADDDGGVRTAAIPARSPMNVLYTSGTTDRPKAVLWTHANALWGGRVSAVHEGLRPDDVHLAYLPMFHINGMCCQVLASLWTGSRVVLLPKWSTSRFWDVSEQYRCTWLPLVPFTVQAMRDMEGRRDHTYRAFSARANYVELEERFGVPCLGWYAMTETVTHVVNTDPQERACPPYAIGRPSAEYEIAIRSAGGGEAEVDEPGELLVRGERGLSVFERYLDDPAATAAAFDAEGWFSTGDVVQRDAAGFIRYVERAKDLIKVGGENVAPAEIERVIAQDGDVLEVAVVARPHEMLEEVPVAFVVAGPGRGPGLEERVVERCREGLADFKVPRQVYVLDSFPKTTIGKVQKAKLRQVAAERGADPAPGAVGG